jgi:hypothetical protein
MLKENSIEHEGSKFKNFISSNKKENQNAVLFFGEICDNKILKYCFQDNHWSYVNYKDYPVNNSASNQNFQNYSKAASFSNGNILITGGCNNLNNKCTVAARTSIAILNQDKSLTIAEFKPMLNNRFSHGCLIIKDTPYVFGGHNGSETLASTEYYDKAHSNWKFLSFMNFERERFGYCAFKDRYIYVFGGFNENILDSIERYDVIHDKWILLNYKMKRPLQDVTATAIDDNKIVLIGGYNGAFHRCVDILDLEIKCWTSLESLRVPRGRSHVYNWNQKVHFKLFNYRFIFLVGNYLILLRILLKFLI